SLVELVLSYINICSNRPIPSSIKGTTADDVTLLPAFGELIKVWSLVKEGCDVDYLAGVVVVEMFSSGSAS
ncbi:hypothetical protein ACJX0J_027866, partial [Zea mays]